MSATAALLRKTLELTLARDDSFPKQFYDRLFMSHPEVIPLFHRNSPGAQRKMFAQKLTMIVDHVEDGPWLAQELRKVAESHVRYGVHPEMYAWVGTALIETLRDACGDDWSSEAEHAWREAYARICETILSPR